MSTHSKGLLDLHNTEWETQGTERPQGARNWAAAEEPPAENFDFHFYWTFKDLETFVDAIEAQLLPQRFGPESINLVGPNSGSFDALIAADSRRIPVIKLAAGADEECQLVAKVLKNNGVTSPVATQVAIEWSSAAVVAKTAGFAVKYQAVAEGATCTGTASTIVKNASDSAVAHGRVRTVIDLPVLVQGKVLELTVVHTGTTDDMENDVCVHMIEVI